jgi:hypothetical protein
LSSGGKRHLNSSSPSVSCRLGCGLLGSLLSGFVFLQNLEVLSESVFARSLQDGGRFSGHVVLGLVLVAAGVGVLHLFPLLLRGLVFLHSVEHIFHLKRKETKKTMSHTKIFVLSSKNFLLLNKINHE